MWDPPQKLSRGSLSLGCADRPPFDAWHSSFHPDGNHSSFHLDEIIAHSIRVAILSGQRLPSPDVSQLQFYPADIPPSPNVSQPQFYPADATFLRMSHSRNSIRLMFHLLRVSHIRRLSSDGRGGRFNFPGQTCLDPLVTPIQSARLTYPRSPHLAPGV
uniref:Uncharacterized protein n=1 Tax=Vitis vinifera TaxID=29760 RepID=A5BC61_VITVI|nr:hypothetical protein VITISV_014984 [Vitis vinifera]